MDDAKLLDKKGWNDFTLLKIVIFGISLYYWF